MEEKETVRTISKEDVEKLVDTLNKSEKSMGEMGYNKANFDIAKIKEVVTTLEGCTEQTVVGIVSTIPLMLPAGAIVVLLELLKSTLKMKITKGLDSMLEEVLSESTTSDEKESDENLKEN